MEQSFIDFKLNLMEGLINLNAAVKNGEIYQNANMMIALTLLSLAGFVVILCFLGLVFGRSKTSVPSDRLISTLDSRLQALEIALSDQKNLVHFVKTQSSADFGYCKQELKAIQHFIDRLESMKRGTSSNLKFASR